VNVIERLGLRLVWGRLEGKMKLKTWGPVIGGAVLILAAVLQALGYGDAANAVSGAGQAVGISGQSPVNATDVGQAVAQLVGGAALAIGIVRKLMAAKPQGVPKP
jgi:hypothetical protein